MIFFEIVSLTVIILTVIYFIAMLSENSNEKNS